MRSERTDIAIMHAWLDSMQRVFVADQRQREFYEAAPQCISTEDLAEHIKLLDTYFNNIQEHYNELAVTLSRDVLEPLRRNLAKREEHIGYWHNALQKRAS